MFVTIVLFVIEPRRRFKSIVYGWDRQQKNEEVPCGEGSYAGPREKYSDRTGSILQH